MINIGALAPLWGMHHLGQLLISLFINNLMNLVATKKCASHHFGVNTEQRKPKQCIASTKTSVFDRQTATFKVAFL